MIIEISIAVIALAFVALVIYLILTLKEAQKTLKNVNLISYDVKDKINTLDPLFKSLENVGSVLERKTNNFKHRATKLDSTDSDDWINNNEPKDERDTASDASKIVSDLVELTGIGVRLWQNFKKRR